MFSSKNSKLAKYGYTYDKNASGEFNKHTISLYDIKTGTTIANFTFQAQKNQRPYGLRISIDQNGFLDTNAKIKIINKINFPAFPCKNEMAYFVKQLKNKLKAERVSYTSEGFIIV